MLDPVSQAELEVLTAMCPDHQPTKARKFDPDCGYCGQRQDAAAAWFAAKCDEAIRALSTPTTPEVTDAS